MIQKQIKKKKSDELINQLGAKCTGTRVTTRNQHKLYDETLELSCDPTADDHSAQQQAVQNRVFGISDACRDVKNTRREPFSLEFLRCCYGCRICG